MTTPMEKFASESKGSRFLTPLTGENLKQSKIILEEAEEIDMDLYHKCWVLPHEGTSWDGEFWFKREELEIIQQEEELQSAHQA